MTSAHETPQGTRHPDDAELRLVQHALDDGLTVLEVAGELDIATAPAFRRELNTLLDRGVRRVVVDLAELSFIDSVALAVLVNAARRLGDDGRLAFVVRRESYGMLIFEASGIDNVLALFATRAEAVEYARS